MVKSFSISATHIAFLFSLIFHIVILSMNINVDRPVDVPTEVFKIRYFPAVKEAPVKEQPVAKKQKPVKKVAAPAPEIPKEIPVETVAEIPEEKPKEKPKEIPEEKPKEIPEEVPKEVPIETPVYPEIMETYIPDAQTKEIEAVEEPPAAVAARPEAMPEIKEIIPEIDLTWIAEELRNRILAIKRYPRMARRMGIEGTVVMTVEFDKMGELVDIHIESSSGHRILDRDALSLVERVSPFRHDAGRNIVIKLPISYDLTER